MKFILQKFIQFLLKNGYKVLALVEKNKEFEGVAIEEIDGPKQVKFLDSLPLLTFKQFLLPACEVIKIYEITKNLRKYEKIGRRRKGEVVKKQAFFGLTILDLQAFLPLNRVFENDPYYQAGIKNTLVIGQGLMPKARGENFFGIKYRKENLKHLVFDVFFENATNPTGQTSNPETKNRDKSRFFVSGTLARGTLAENCDLRLKARTAIIGD